MHEFLVANGYPALFLLSFLASTLIPLGSEWLLVALIVQGFAPLPVVLVPPAGNLMGACTSYGIGVCGSTFLTARYCGWVTGSASEQSSFLPNMGSGACC